MVAALRVHGLPARYASGYIETRPAPGKVKLRGADASHAWVSAWVPGAGWVEVDPTNDAFVDDRYVILGWGRDYADVPPLRGVIFTEGSGSRLTVSVDLVPAGTDRVL
jgi:transglutaminase-like putative cysteine protease